MILNFFFSHHSGKTNRRKRAYNWNTHVDDFVNGVHPDRPTCRAKYQQSPVEVYARFLAIDQVSVMMFICLKISVL